MQHEVLDLYSILAISPTCSFSKVAQIVTTLKQTLNPNLLERFLNRRQLHASEPMRLRILKRSREYAEFWTTLLTTPSGRLVMDSLLNVNVPPMDRLSKTDLLHMIQWHNNHAQRHIDIEAAVGKTWRGQSRAKEAAGPLCLSKSNSILCAYCQETCEHAILLKCKCAANILHEKCMPFVCLCCPICSETISTKKIHTVAAQDLLPDFIATI